MTDDDRHQEGGMMWKCDICGTYKKINDIIYFVKLYSNTEKKYVEIPINLCGMSCLKKLYQHSIKERENIAKNKYISKNKSQN